MLKTTTGHSNDSNRPTQGITQFHYETVVTLLLGVE